MVKLQRTQEDMSSASTSSLSVRNRANPADIFGLLSIIGWIFDLPSALHCIEVSFGGEEKRLAAAEVTSTSPANDSQQVEFHLFTQRIANGQHQLNVVARFVDGSSVTFPSLTLDVRNNTELASAVATDLRAHGTPVIAGNIIDSTMFPYADGTARAWFKSDFSQDIPMSLEPAPSASAAQAHLLKWGFCVLHEQIPSDLVDQFKRELFAALDRGSIEYRAGSSDRIRGAHQLLPSARAVWLYPAVLNFLEDYFQDVPCACQTLTYVNGSEQSGHQDSIHLTAYPTGYMCGVWVALEDVQKDSGELFVYPGSHQLASLKAADLDLGKVVNDDYSHYTKFDAAIERLISENGYERLVYRPKAGQILVWHENLIHGGSPRVDHSRTRLSVVSHYFARGAVAYYDSRGEAAALETLQVE